MAKAKNHQPRQGEMPYKTWLCCRAEQLGVTRHTLEMKISRGRYPMPNRRLVNKRVVFVSQ